MKVFIQHGLRLLNLYFLPLYSFHHLSLLSRRGLGRFRLVGSNAWVKVGLCRLAPVFALTHNSALVVALTRRSAVLVFLQMDV